MSKFLIVGHGLAGAVLAHTLIEKKQDVSVMDTNLGHSASSVSVGLVNPLIGPKLNLPKKMVDCLQIEPTVIVERDGTEHVNTEDDLRKEQRKVW